MSLPAGPRVTWTVPASVPINRMKRLMTHLLASGDDDGVVKVRLLAPPRSPGCGAELRRPLWDPREPGPLRTYTHHFEYISDFMWLEDKKQLVATRRVRPRHR